MFNLDYIEHTLTQTPDAAKVNEIIDAINIIIEYTKTHHRLLGELVLEKKNKGKIGDKHNAR